MAKVRRRIIDKEQQIALTVEFKSNVYYRNINRYYQFVLMFRDLFRIELSEYFDYVSGFDEEKFKEFIKPKKGESINTATLRQFDKEGLDILRKVMDKQDEE